ncbi:hypothetical protein TSH100_10620 [Azospirillum sp. TSH100]|uniref:hypothetical protein n=1 Tax=Azospirillum sp. TSH100 TaxID=652764 RepID=UPI000D617BCC|nr:hypothetical protein [Azospirillum sp. TSH100]PWC87235.1 hypothetical protein TSH100_10620 [Azospirillum sp. TSH100]QCG89983.1 hypothetical protein E6C72_19565 [Azospirillum sp. TSH100]
MSARTIVSLGVWILAMVLIGTMTVGLALAFYLMLTVACAVVAAGLTLLARRRENHRGEQSYL